MALQVISTLARGSVIREKVLFGGKSHTLIKMDEITNLGAVRIRLRSMLDAIRERNAAGAAKKTENSAGLGIDRGKLVKRLALGLTFSDALARMVLATAPHEIHAGSTMALQRRYIVELGRLAGEGKFGPLLSLLYVRFYLARVERVMEGFRYYRRNHDLKHLAEETSRTTSLANQAGEGWLLPAEMISMLKSGVAHIICLQPFGQSLNPGPARRSHRLVRWPS
jgi:hypothetical protein